VFRQFRDIVIPVVNGASPHSAEPRRKPKVFHTHGSRPPAAPGLLHNREFRRAVLFGGAFSGLFWLATAYVAGRLLLNL